MKALLFDPQSKPSEVYFVRVDDLVELEGGRGALVLDGVRKDFMGQALKVQLENHQEWRTFFFRIELNEERFNAAKEYLKPGKFRSRWLRLTLAKRGEAFFADRYEQQYTVQEEGSTDRQPVKSLTRLSSRSPRHGALNSLFNWRSSTFAPAQEIAARINALAPLPSVHRLGLYHVGQGNLSAVQDARGISLVYFDLGGGFAWNKFTYPHTLKVCFSAKPVIVISHWDMDHLETAKRHFADPELRDRLNNLVWVVPEQVISPSYFKLLRYMRASGTVLVWPAHRRGRIRTWFGEIIKCRGRDKNNSGLALVVTSPQNPIQTVLHPADAAYINIPFISRRAFDGLVATHHGAEFAVANSPVPVTASEGHIAYSYGAGNTYSHPRVNATNAHRGANWHNERDTNNGHVVFAIAHPHPPCGGVTCSPINQTF